MELIPGKENPHTLTRDQLFDLAKQPHIQMEVAALAAIDGEWHLEQEDHSDTCAVYVGETDDFLITVNFEQVGDIIVGSVDVDGGDFGFGTV